MQSTVTCRMLLAVLTVMLASCVNMVDSVRIDVSSPGGERALVACRSPLGAYSLGKSYLKVKVDRGKLDGQITNVLSKVSELRRADNKRTYCLDHLGSSFTSDQLIVKKNGPTADSAGGQLLTLVASNGVDESAVVIRRLVRTTFLAIANGAARARTGQWRDEETVAELEYDPFDQAWSGRVNEALRTFGFCLILAPYTFDPAQASVQDYCNDPSQISTKPTPFAKLYAEFDQDQFEPVQTNGILYRPRAPYQLRIYSKTDPTGSEPWVLRRMEPLYFENISPVLSIGLDRAVFAGRKTAATFDNGALLNVCINKGSELEGGLSIPLEIVRSIVRLPTQILQIQYDDLEQSSKLADAELEILKAQKKVIAAQSGGPAVGALARPTDMTKAEIPVDDVAYASPESFTDFETKWAVKCGTT